MQNITMNFALLLLMSLIVEVIPTESPTTMPIEIEQTKIPVDAFLCDSGKSKLSDQAKKFQIGQSEW
jgi:hypothetical protein